MVVERGRRRTWGSGGGEAPRARGSPGVEAPRRRRAGGCGGAAGETSATGGRDGENWRKERQILYTDQVGMYAMPHTPGRV
jgi:hypothetical protein